MRKLYVLLMMIAFSSCSPYGLIRLKTTQPANINISKEIKSVCFVIRHTVSKELYESSNFNIINFNKINQPIYDLCFEGFYDELNKTNRFSKIMYYNTDLEVIPIGTEPQPINWVKVGKICSETGADIIIVLEKADLSAGLSDSLNMNVVVWNYKFRCYDPYRFSILNDTVISDYETFSRIGEGVDYFLDDEKMIRSYNLGKMYANNIIPKKVIVDRLYYNKNNNLLHLGSYYIEQKQASNAILLWKKIIEKESRSKDMLYKICINISLAYEIDNNLQEALKYASLSLHYITKKDKDNRKKLSIDLIKSLKERINYDKILNS